MPDVSVSLQNVEKWYGKTVGVDRVSFEVYSGEFFFSSLGRVDRAKRQLCD